MTFVFRVRTYSYETGKMIDEMNCTMSGDYNIAYMAFEGWKAEGNRYKEYRAQEVSLYMVNDAGEWHLMMTDTQTTQIIHSFPA